MLDRRVFALGVIRQRVSWGEKWSTDWNVWEEWVFDDEINRLRSWVESNERVVECINVGELHFGEGHCFRFLTWTQRGQWVDERKRVIEKARIYISERVRAVTVRREWLNWEGVSRLVQGEWAGWSAIRWASWVPLDKRVTEVKTQIGDGEGGRRTNREVSSHLNAKSDWLPIRNTNFTEVKDIGIW